jgi:CRP/FNR family transcriptional regulator
VILVTARFRGVPDHSPAMSESGGAREPLDASATARALGRAEVFAPLAEADVAALAASAQARRVARGERLWAPGDAPEDLAVVARGRLQCVLRRNGDRDFVSAVIGPRGACGIDAIVDPSERHDAVEALEPTLVLLVPAAEVRTLLERRHAFALHVARLLAREVRSSRAAAEEVALRSPLQRVARLLTELGRDGDEGRLDATQASLAARLGTVREVVGRSLRRLEDAGIVERHGRAFRILRPDELRRIASGGVTAVTTARSGAA